MGSFELFKVNDKEAQVCLGDRENVAYIVCLLNSFEVILMVQCND